MKEKKSDSKVLKFLIMYLFQPPKEKSHLIRHFMKMLKDVRETYKSSEMILKKQDQILINLSFSMKTAINM